MMAVTDTSRRALSAETFIVPGIKDKTSGFLSLIRPLFFILTPINAASAAVLSLGGFPALSKCILGFLSVAFASCAVNVFNDYIDRERDKTIWPNRAIPAGRARPNEALLVVFLSLVISLAIAWWAFNTLTFSILLLALIMGGIYSVYLRDKVGYLALPPIVGLIYLGGWAAFSPETLFTSFLPWYLYLLGVVWQAAHIMIYYPLHLVPGKGTSYIKTPSALFFTPSPKAAIKIGIVFTCFTLILGALLPLFTTLSSFYIIPVIAAGAYALIYGFRFYKDILNKEKGIAAFRAMSIFRLVISAAILLTVAFMQV
jgi:4-hydroxybenzoate polyprenyltransferase